MQAIRFFRNRSRQERRRQGAAIGAQGQATEYVLESAYLSAEFPSAALHWDELEAKKKRYRPLKYSTVKTLGVRHFTGTVSDDPGDVDDEKRPPFAQKR